MEILNYLLGAFATLFSVVNPLGMVPVFLALTSADSNSYRAKLAKRACIYMIIILAFFLFLGTFIMDFFGISLISLRIAGGVIVFKAGLELLSNKDKHTTLSDVATQEAIQKSDIALTPLAMPLLSGPGSIAATIAMATKRPDFNVDYAISPSMISLGLIFISIMLVGILSYSILRVSQRILPILGNNGLEAITRIMGFITITVGVQFVLNGVKDYVESFG